MFDQIIRNSEAGGGSEELWIAEGQRARE